MTKRDAARLVTRAVRRSRHSPETFALAHADLVYGVSGRTIRRWMDGERTPHAAVLERLARYLESDQLAQEVG